MAYSYKIKHQCICKNCDSIVVYSQNDIVEERKGLGFEGEDGIQIDSVVYCPYCRARIILKSNCLLDDDINNNGDKEDFYDDYDYSDCYVNSRDDYRDDEYPDYYWDDLDD